MSERSDFLVFGSPDIGEDEIREVEETLRSGWIGTGPRVAQFEVDFAAYKGVAEAVAVSSCTAALHLSCLAAGLGPGDEVITTPLTFAATVNAILHSGATPVLADVDPSTMNLNPDLVAERISKKTRAIIPVHFAGLPCDMNQLTQLATEHGLKIIEDCAHAIEARYHDHAVGTIGDFGCFSFYVTKNVITGEGGMVLAKSQSDSAQIKVLALHGMSHDAWKRFGDEGFKHYQVVYPGFKYNMTDIQAALGIHQLRRVETKWLARKRIWDVYDKAYASLPVSLPPDAPGSRHAYHLYTLRIDQTAAGVQRDEFLDRMTARNIGVGVHYLSVAEHPYYRRHLGWQPEDYPHSMRIGRETVSLPLSPKLSEADVDDVIDSVVAILA